MGGGSSRQALRRSASGAALWRGRLARDDDAVEDVIESYEDAPSAGRSEVSLDAPERTFNARSMKAARWVLIGVVVSALLLSGTTDNEGLALMSAILAFVAALAFGVVAWKERNASRR